MEAKDTVMSDEQIRATWNDEAMTCFGGQIIAKYLVRDQAEISFKAGGENEYKEWVKAFMKAGILIADVATVGIAIEETKRAGVRKVVEWTATELGVDWSKEKKQLKEWGIR